jgi:hypothetical protein
MSEISVMSNYALLCFEAHAHSGFQNLFKIAFEFLNKIGGFLQVLFSEYMKARYFVAI